MNQRRDRAQPPTSRRPVRSRGPRAEEWEGRRVTPVTASGLEVLFVGLNPGRYSAANGHHFAGPGNHFWRLLADSGLTPRKLDPSEDRLLPEMGLGITNIVARPSPGAEDLERAELARGGAFLRELVDSLRPRVVCLLGKEVYRHFAGLRPSATMGWGRQDRETVPGVREFLAPNPSSRSTIPYAERLACFKDLAALISSVP